jgi:hypothetical protein
VPVLLLKWNATLEHVHATQVSLRAACGSGCAVPKDDDDRTDGSWERETSCRGSSHKTEREIGAMEQTYERVRTAVGQYHH